MDNYSRFAQYYIECRDKLNELNAEADELLELSQAIPRALDNEIFRHTAIMEILNQACKELYNKEPKQVYKEGWDFWFKEDTELRAKNYGEKIIVRVKTDD